MRKQIFIIILTTIISAKVFSQGCVAIRSTGGVCSMLDHPDSTNAHGGWIFNSNNRYYRSYKHFIGRQEQTQRIALGTNVINHAYTQDMALTRVFNSRWAVGIDIPILANTRSSLYEHGGITRASTSSFGLGDIRITTYAWLLDPAKTKNFNIQAGLGIKFATGAYNYQDYFKTTGPGGTNLLGPVDQSIQLGDGGTGITLEVNTFYHLTSTFNLYGNFYYLSNPREVNGVSTARGGTASASTIANGSDVMSVPDQYMWRAGASANINKFTFSAGLRDECLPVHDLIGGSNGFRRPGYILSVEPGVTYAFKKFTVYVFAPWALIRDRTQSVPDILKTQQTGVYAHGDAAFADYVINVGVSFKL
ncbi:hypothetical protein [Mucilaginibacter sp.]|uniref:hypothetical protein n=1 Tax=Mucilaginibacter sp. TaxID=1882438 RepID=UPI00260781DB|nr:hypothetical protein [Mucilaginibacter sp.]MDB5032717.1 hypothetical protein [Mucilaginibacter sp.]